MLKAQPLPRAYALQSGKSTKYHNRPYFGQVLIEEADLYLTTNRRVRISSRPSACSIRMYCPEDKVLVSIVSPARTTLDKAL